MSMKLLFMASSSLVGVTSPKPVTSLLTLTERWDNVATDYTTGSNLQALAGYADVVMTPSDEGIIAEGGGATVGWALYAHGGNIYLRCGFNGLSSSAVTIVASAPIPANVRFIEFSIGMDGFLSGNQGRAFLYINGQMVASTKRHDVTETDISGSDAGGIAEIHGTAPDNAGGWSGDGAGSFTGTVNYVDIFAGQMVEPMTAPVLLSTNPSDDAPDIAVDSPLTLVFDKPVEAIGAEALGSPRFTLRQNDGGWSGIEQYNSPEDVGTGLGSIEFTNSTTVVITPNANFQNEGLYSLRAFDGPIVDMYGNKFVGLSADGDMNWTVVAASDTTAPQEILFVPADEGTDVAVSSPSTSVQYDEEVQHGVGNVYLYRWDGAAWTIIEQINVGTPANIGTGPGQVNIVGDTFTAYWTNDYLPGEQYSMRMQSQAVRDLAGIGSGGIPVGTYTWTTAAAAPAGTEAAPLSYEFAAIPAEDDGAAYVVIKDGGFSGDAVTAVEYRTQVLASGPDMTTLNDPTASWGAWNSLGATTGRTRITGLGTDAVAIQLRVQRNGEWSLPSTFKRIGENFFGYDDSIQVHGAPVREATPATMYWGTDNAAGEGKQRVADDVTAITSGDPSSHFEIVTVDGRKYVAPTATGAAAWTGGESYTLGFDGSQSNVAVSIELNSATLASGEWNLGAASVAELEAWYTRVGSSQGALDGKKIRLTYGFYDFGSLSDNPRRNWHGVDNIDNGFTLWPANVDQKPMVHKFFVAKPSTGGTGKRQLIAEDIDFFLLQIGFAASSGGIAGNACEIREDDNTAASYHRLNRNIVRSDLLEARHGVNIRGTGDFVRLAGFDLEKLRGLEMADNIGMNLTYPYTIAGVELVNDGFDKNMSTHVHADYMNIVPHADRPTSGKIQRNRFREHCGDQNEIHSDGWHSFWTGSLSSYDNVDVQGNIWFPGYEGCIAPGGFPASVANNVLVYSGGDLTLGADTYDHKYVSLTETGTITFPTPASTNLDGAIAPGDRYRAGYITALNNISDGDITVVVPGLSNITLAPNVRVMVYDDGGSWTTELPDASFQGALYQNNGNTVYDDFKFRDNIVLGIAAVSAALWSGLVGSPTAKPDDAPASRKIRVSNNAWLTYLHDPVLDDLNGDGVVNASDGYYTDSYRARFEKGLRRREAGVETDEPTDIVYERSFIGDQVSYEVPVTVRDIIALRAGATDTAANRDQYLEDANNSDWRPLAIDTFAKAIEFVRTKAGTDAASNAIGAVGPTDGAVGYFNHVTGVHNGFAALEIVKCFPENGGTLPDGEEAWIEFNHSIDEDTLGAAAIHLAGGAAQSTTVRIDGRRIYMSAAQSNATDYEMILPAGAAQNAYASADKTPALVSGGFSWTNSTGAYKNILAQIDGGSNDQSQYFDGADHALTAAVRFDTNQYSDASPFMGTGPSIFSAEVFKGAGTAGIEVFVTDGGNTAYNLDINTANGDVVTAPSGTVDVDYGVIDQGTHYRLWIRVDLATATRYYFDVNDTGGNFTWRRPMLVDADASTAPWIAFEYDFGAAAPPPAITYADAEVPADFSDPAWVAGFTKTIDGDGYLITPTGNVRVDTSAGNLAPRPTTGVVTYVVKFRLTSGGSDSVINFRLQEVGGTNSTPSYTTSNGSVNLSGLDSGDVIDMGGGVFKFWMKQTVTGGARLIFDAPSAAESEFDLLEPAIFYQDLSVAEITALD